MNEYSFDVGVSTHDHLKNGVLIHHVSRVEVAADSYHTARLIALEMSAIGGWMPTDIWYVE